MRLTMAWITVYVISLIGKIRLKKSKNSKNQFFWENALIFDIVFVSSLYDGPTCGNGFTEPGEECDCGLAEHCENPCCDANTCMIHLNATCASGTCCDMEVWVVSENLRKIYRLNITWWNILQFVTLHIFLQLISDLSCESRRNDLP